MLRLAVERGRVVRVALAAASVSGVNLSFIPRLPPPTPTRAPPPPTPHLRLEPAPAPSRASTAAPPPARLDGDEEGAHGGEEGAH
eukprot:830945-Rhodomonas_salina.1